MCSYHMSIYPIYAFRGMPTNLVRTTEQSHSLIAAHYTEKLESVLGKKSGIHQSYIRMDGWKCPHDYL